MKLETTEKSARRSFSKIIKIGYCELQTLLDYERPVAYTCSREYGWKSDIYSFGDVAISTGYAPFGNICPDYEVVREFEEQARKIRYDYTIPYEEQREKLRSLLDTFIEAVTA